MSEKTDNAVSEETLPATAPAPEVPAAEPDAAPAAEPESTEMVGGDEASAIPGGQPRWYAKGRAKIPDQLFPACIKSDGVKAWTISFFAVLAGFFFWLFMSFHGWAGVMTALAGIIGLYYALLAAKRTPEASRNLAVSIGMLALVSFMFVLGGCKTRGMHAEADWGRLLEAQRTAEQAIGSMSTILDNK